MNLTPQLQRKHVVEFIGTFFLVFTVGPWSHRREHARAAGPAGHWLRADGDDFRGRAHLGGTLQPRGDPGGVPPRQVPPRPTWPYMVAQVLGAGGRPAAVVLFIKGNPSATAAHPGHPAGAGGGVPVHLRPVLCGVERRHGQGNQRQFVLRPGHRLHGPDRRLRGGPISGGAFNPAVALGQIVHGAVGVGHIWEYWLAQFLAGLAAGRVFLVLDGAQPTPAR